jgi:hypothetical protein
VEDFKYLETTLTIKILFRKKLKADWSQGMVAIILYKMFFLTVCYPKILKILIHRTIILPVVLLVAQLEGRM